MDSRTLAEADAWLDQYVTASQQLEAGSWAAVQFAYSEIRDWLNPAETIAATLAAMAAAEAAREASASLSAQFMATIVALLRGLRGIPTTPRLQVPYPRKANPFDVYSRPVFVWRDMVKVGRTEADALAAAFDRAEIVAEMDRILAERDAAVAQLEAMWEAEGEPRYRRVLRPELSKTGSCGLCVAAARRIYKSDSHMPMHDRCKCKVMPLLPGADPANEINEADLSRLYSDADGSGRAALKRTRYRIEQHGELGPYLVAA